MLRIGDYTLDSNNVVLAPMTGVTDRPLGTLCREHGAGMTPWALVTADIDIPVFANGDIDSPQRARFVLDYTGADGVMIGRAAQGRPWIFRELRHYLRHGDFLAPMPATRQRAILLSHLRSLHAFYGETKGVRIARKHVAWYLKDARKAAVFRKHFNGLTTPQAQLRATKQSLATPRTNKEQAA